MNHLRVLLAAPLVAALAACSEDTKPIKGEGLPIVPANVSAYSATNFRTLAHELWEADQWLSSSDSLDALAAGLSISADAPIEPTNPAPNQLFLPQDEIEFESFLDDVEAFLKQRAFTDDQIESQTGTEITYRLRAASFCDPEWDGDVVDTCTELLETVELRFRVTSFSEGDVDMTLLVGSDREAAVQIELHDDIASVEVGFDPALDLLQALLDSDDGEATSDAAVTGEGSVRLVVRRLADHQVRLTAEVTSAISIESNVDGERLSLELGVGSTSLEIDTAAGHMTADVDMGRIALSGPKQLLDSALNDDCYEVIDTDAEGKEIVYEECDSDTVDPEAEPALEGTAAIELSRLALYIDFTDLARRIDLRGLVLGTLALTVDDHTVLETRLDDGAKALDFHFVLLDDDTVEISLSRAAEATMLMKFGLEPVLFEDMLDSFAEDEDLRLVAEGVAPKAIAVENGLYMSSGKLTLESKHAKNPSVVIDEGMCAFRMAVDETADEETSHPFDLEVANQCPAD